MNPLTKIRDWWFRSVTDRLDRIEANTAPELEAKHIDRALSQLDHQMQKVHDAALTKLRELDYARPEPMSVGEAVCMCSYLPDGRREYRCRSCMTGFGPDRETRGTAYDEWRHAQDIQ